MKKIIAEVQYGPHAQAIVYEDGSVSVYGREGGGKRWELEASAVTGENLLWFYNGSEYLAYGIFKRIVAVQPIPSFNYEAKLSNDDYTPAVEEVEEAEETKEDTTLVNYYECNGAMSLDKEYMEAVADGKGEVVARCESLPADMIDELLTRNAKLFDPTFYNDLLEDGKANEANEYWDQNHKCISAASYGFNW